MGTRARRWWQAVWLAAGLLGAHAAPAQSLGVARLDADPVPEQVLAGEFDRAFVTASAAVIHERERQPHWWRVTSSRDIPSVGSPQLVLQSPGFNQVEVWVPGRAMPIRRALTGPHADRTFSTRALVVPLADGLAMGEAIYVRVHAPSPAAMPVSVEPLQAVHRADLYHVGWRAISLSSLLVLAALALGFWVGIGERSYAYLMLTLLAQFGYFALVGGEVRVVRWAAEQLGSDPRLAHLFGLLAIVSGVVFLAQYLDLRNRQPRLMHMLDACCAALGVLWLASLLTADAWVAILAKLALLLIVGAVLAAAVSGTMRRQRAAYFLLLSWLPMLVLLALRLVDLQAPWSHAAWIGYAFHAAFVVSGLVITIGLADTIQQLKRDRDQASKLATYDGLTGALSRPAIEDRLKSAVAKAHRTGRPLSLVFFDIDRFKRINDDYGHRVGDTCLRIIGLRTRNRLRNFDLFGRFGGDEILVILPNTRLGEALGVAENLRSAVNCRPLAIDGHALEASLSLGVAELAAGESAEHLLERADEALYASKAAGRDRVTGHNSRVTGRMTVAPK